MSVMLRDVAEHGYAPCVAEGNPDVEVGSLRNVLGVVGRSTFAPSVPPEAWDDPNCDEIVVAASQAMRLLLARKLKC